ncbi:MAG: GNAT family N-acetyltransferase [Rhodobiaceae bacterium]|nr:GNAT family N-acetyltransferase [Rhodobiaceae bacterium]MCC0042310.1 GNAT family N-acetyltransferase [Rhodobiaceae bacterium]
MDAGCGAVQMSLANLPLSQDQRNRFTPATGAATLVNALTPRRIRARFDGEPPPRTLARIGSLEVRLARTSAEVRLAQALRYAVFYEELQASADARTRRARRDFDRFDPFCDHVLVVDHDAPVARNAIGRRQPAVVGTYRLLRHERAISAGGFYTAQEYDLDPMLARHADKRLLELGRSCVLSSHRSRRTLEVLWAGVWTYIRHHGLDAMIGCASFQGTDPQAHALALSFLHHHAGASGDWRVAARPHLRVPMDMMACAAIDERAALRALPPLIKGYLRLGAMVGDGAVVDQQFGTVDVCMLLPKAAINPRYFDHFGGPDASVQEHDPLKSNGLERQEHALGSESGANPCRSDDST